MFDMMNIMGKVKEVQARMKQVKDNLGRITVTSEAGAGMVKATVNGNRQVIKLEIDPDIIKKEDQDMMQDLIAAAVNKGMAEIEVKIKEEMRKSTEGIIPNIPGFDFMSMF